MPKDQVRWLGYHHLSICSDHWAFLGAGVAERVVSCLRRQRQAVCRGYNEVPKFARLGQ